MVELLPELLIGPLLVGGSTWAGRRWGFHLGGLLSAFPAVVGPVLFITASERGAHSAAEAANATLLGLVGLSAFVLTYSWAARYVRWAASLVAAWVCAGVLAALVGWLVGGTPFPAGLLAAVAALLLARVGMPGGVPDPRLGSGARTRVLPRMLATALLVVLLSAAAILGGPLLGGLLSGLPVIASVLAAFTHRREGSDAVIALLRGMLAGMSGFVGFCAVIAWLVVPAGAATAFALATAIAVVLAMRPGLPLGPPRPARHPSG